MDTGSDPFISRQIIAPYSQGELSGLTFAVKDNIDVAGRKTGYGSPAWADSHAVPAANAVCLEQLLGAGGQCLGKTKTDELAYSLLGVNAFYGTPVNPAAPDRVPGGSSSGSASAVAGGDVDFAIGTDTGGSVRVPASNCGIWGYRPSHGAVSVAGVLDLAPSYDTVGILARTGDVLEKAMGVLLAEDMPGKTDDRETTVCFLDDVFDMSDRRILDRLAPCLKRIKSICSTRRVTLSGIAGPRVDCTRLFELLGILLSTEIWNTFGAWVRTSAPELGPGTAYGLHHYAESTDRKDLLVRLRERTAFRERINGFLRGGTILCFPTTADPAPRLADITPGFSTGDYVPRAMGVNAVSSLARTPQITVPVTGAGGVPAGLSFVAGCGRDRMLIDFCNRIYPDLAQGLVH